MTILETVRRLRPKAFEKFMVIFPILKDAYLESRERSPYTKILLDYLNQAKSQEGLENSVVKTLEELSEFISKDEVLNSAFLRKESEIFNSLIYPSNQSENGRSKTIVRDYLNGNVQKQHKGKPVTTPEDI